MQKNSAEYANVVAIAPVSKGFGFVYMRDRHTLLDWGTRRLNKGDKNKQSLLKVDKLITRLEPEVVVLPDALEEGSRRQERIRKLVRQFVSLAERRGISVRLISKAQLRDYFFGGERGTKHGIALSVAKRFPEQLGDLLPPERQQWMSENHFTQLFDAAALALASFGLDIRKV
jgi:hypothetical protein